jgi:hypothetical protein
MRIRDRKNSDPGWKKFGSGIFIPDPQHLLYSWLYKNVQIVQKCTNCNFKIVKYICELLFIYESSIQFGVNLGYLQT